MPSLKNKITGQVSKLNKEEFNDFKTKYPHYRNAFDVTDTATTPDAVIAKEKADDDISKKKKNI